MKTPERSAKGAVAKVRELRNRMTEPTACDAENVEVDISSHVAVSHSLALDLAICHLYVRVRL